MNLSRKTVLRLFLHRNATLNLNRNKTSTAQYCLESVKQYDYENFICSLLLKNDIRACAFAVRSFNVEVARTFENVSQPQIGLMRLKFWEDAINSCFSNDIATVPKHPIAIELFKAIGNSKLTKRYFQSLILSRQERISRNSFSSIEEIEKYVEKSVSPTYYLILESSQVKNVNADHAASHLGKAQGIIQQLRTVPIARKLDIISIPKEILLKNKVSEEEVLRGVSSERLSECAFEVASRAHQHLVKARSLMKNVPKEGRAVLLPAVAAENYLNALQKLNYDVLHPKLQHRSWTWLPKLWVKHFQNKY